MLKIIGKKKKLTPEGNLLKLEQLNKEMDALRPYKKPKGLILKFKTFRELDEFNITRASKKI